MKHILVLVALTMGLVACGPREQVVIERVITATPEPTPRSSPTRISPAPAPPTAAPPKHAEPSLSDFDIELVVIEDQCFNTAGALVVVRPDLSYDGPTLPASAKYLLVYRILGGENVETFNLEITGSSYQASDQMIQTSSCTYRLSVELVRLMEN